MRVPRYTKRFRRDYEKMKHSGKKIRKLDTVMEMLLDGILLPSKYHDHALQGQLKSVRDCHIEGDWLLLYELGIDSDGNEIITFYATDNHENLFD